MATKAQKRKLGEARQAEALQESIRSGLAVQAKDKEIRRRRAEKAAKEKADNEALDKASKAVAAILAMAPSVDELAS